MDNFINYLKEHYKLIIAIVITIILLGGGILSYYLINNYQAKKENREEIASLESYNTEDEEKEKSKTSKEETKIKVDIKGAVQSPGVYEVSAETIINDLINMAGGLTADASTKNINLALKAEDEMAIIIYTQKELEQKEEKVEDACYTDSYDISNCLEEKKSVVKKSNTKTTNNSSSSTQVQSTPSIVSINSATQEELMTLSGIGEAKANNIIAYREENGGFKSIEEIMNVKGIGEAIFNKIKDHITL